MTVGHIPQTNSHHRGRREGGGTTWYGGLIDAQGIDAYTSIFGFEIMFGVIGCICLVMLLRTIKKHFGAESVDKTEEAEATEIAGGEATI